MRPNKSAAVHNAGRGIKRKENAQAEGTSPMRYVVCISGPAGSAMHVYAWQALYHPWSGHGESMGTIAAYLVAERM